MSRRPISHSADLTRLQNEGYELDVRDGHLLVAHVPFRSSSGEVGYGTLVSVLELQNDTTAKPSDHVAYFIGGIPHGTDGKPMSKILHSPGPQMLAAGIESTCSFSSKPLSGAYRDYYDKVTTYIRLISAPARALDATVTAQTYPVVRDSEESSVFHYIDTASSRAGITALGERLKMEKIAIVGVGGTGSYILDFLAKTEVGEIHLFDGDGFLQHNAFRAPGAVSGEELEERLTKVEYLARLYSKLRRGIVAHAYGIDGATVEELRDFNFVFLTAESSEAKALIPAKLIEFGVPFIDVGMGLYLEGAIGGILRTTLVTPVSHEHAAKRISSGGRADDPYAQNIQIVELNAMNAAFAVLKWKKFCGYYFDEEVEHHSLYVIGGNALMNREQGKLDTASEVAA